MTMPPQRYLGFAGGLILTLQLAGCAGEGLASLTSASVAGYQQSTGFSPSGFWEREIAPQHLEVSAQGTESTPADRVEKIALARAAEIGVEKKLPYFKVASVSHSVVCRSKRDGYRSQVPPLRAPRVVLDVLYEKVPPAGDAEFRAAQATFEQLQAELAGASVAPDVAAAAAADAKAKCGA